MHGGTGQLYAPGQGGFVDFQPVEAWAAKAGDQAGMHVDDLVAVSGNDLLAQHAQEPGQHHHVNIMALQGVQQGGVKGGAVGIVFAADHGGFHAKAGGAFQRVDAGLAGDHQHDPAVGVLAAALTFQQSLQVGAAAGDQNCYTLHTSSTPSPSTMVPRR